MSVVVDTSVWIDFFAGRETPTLDDALAAGSVVLAPIVVAELVTGARTAADREPLVDLLEDLPLHDTPVEHWIRVGKLRRRLLDRGLQISTPDAHVAQCALDLEALLLSRDEIFTRTAGELALRVAAG